MRPWWWPIDSSTNSAERALAVADQDRDAAVGRDRPAELVYLMNDMAWLQFIGGVTVDDVDVAASPALSGARSGASVCSVPGAGFSTVMRPPGADGKGALQVSSVLCE